VAYLFLVRRTQLTSGRMKPEKVSTANDAVDFVRRHGIVLVSGKGPVPRLSEAIVGSRIKGS